jgi:hypothetical protein
VKLRTSRRSFRPWKSSRIKDFSTNFSLSYLLKLRRVAHDVDLVVLVVRRLLEDLIEDVQDVDPVKKFALAERPRLDLAQLLDQLCPVAGFQFVDEVLTFWRHF